MKRFEGKKAIVTGGAQGVGAAIAGRLAHEGCDVGVFDLNPEGANETAQTIAAETASTALGIGVDVTDAAAMRKAVETSAETLGGLDIFVSNAGILISGGKSVV